MASVYLCERDMTTEAAPDEIAALRRDVERLRALLPERVDVDPDGAGAGLAKLVLTLVEFLRQLLERQAIRRMEGGTLTDEEVERMGVALIDRKSTRLNSSHGYISYAVFCLKKKNKTI